MFFGPGCLNCIQVMLNTIQLYKEKIKQMFLQLVTNMLPKMEESSPMQAVFGYGLWIRETHPNPLETA